MKYRQFFNEVSNLTFNISSVGYHHGQSDLLLTADKNGKVVGKIEFSVYEDMPYIQWIEVVDDERRSGIGKQMIGFLQKEYPNSEIKIGGTTDLGTKFFNALPKTFEKNNNYEVLVKKLQSLKNAEKRLMAYVEKTGKSDDRISNLFNKISDEMWETEEALKDMSPGKTKFIENSIEEDYPSNWNLETFKALKSFSKRIAYCNQTLQRIASGSSRVVYKIDEEKVLKLAKNKKGIAQNGVEHDWYVQQHYEDVVAKVFDVDENNLWLEMELAKKLGPNRFKVLVNASINEVDQYLQNRDREDNGKSSYSVLSPDEKKRLDGNEWLQQIYELCRNLDLMVGDFGRISSFGEVIREGKPAVVIIDMGLSKTVFNDFYGVN